MFKSLNATALGARGTLSEQVELALLGGFRGVDANMSEVAAIVAERGLDYGRSIFASAKLDLSTWTLPAGWTSDEETYQRELQRLPQLAELSQQLGCSRVLTLVEPASDDRPLHENFEWHRQRLATVADILKQHDCRLGLEFNATKTSREGKAYEFIHTLDATVQLGEAVGTGNVGVVIDAFHWYVSGATVEDVQKLRGDQVVAVQVADAPADVPREQQRDSVRALPGRTGVIDCVALLKALAGIGYNGPVTPEPSREQLRSMSRERAVRETAEALSQIWTQAELQPAP
jgi:sugar phosphate isomerase/epimerase